MQLRQFDLQLAFSRSRMARKDVEDELRSVDHPALDDLFNIALLRRTEVVIEKKDIRIDGRCGTSDLLEFSSTYERRGIGPIPMLQNFSNDLCARAFGERA
jgi:hypothetical protein